MVISSYHSMIERENEKEQKVKGKEKQLGDLLPSTAPHVVARQKHPLYPARAEVLNDFVRWDTPWPDYAPTHFEAAVLAKNVRGLATGGGWADPAEIDAELKSLISTVRMAFDSPSPSPSPSQSPPPSPSPSPSPSP